MKRLNSKRMVCRPDMTHAGVIAEIGGPAKHGNTPTEPVFYPQRFSRSCSTLVNAIDSVGYSAAAISQLGSYRKCQRPLPIAQHLIDHGSRV
jgi:hypothetical protein